MIIKGEALAGEGCRGRPRLVVTADGAGVVSHAGTALLGGLAEGVRLIGWVDEELAVLGGLSRRGRWSSTWTGAGGSRR